MVQEYVTTRRREIRVVSGREPLNTFIPQEHLPRREAGVDFGEVAIRLHDELVAIRLQPTTPSPYPGRGGGTHGRLVGDGG